MGLLEEGLLQLSLPVDPARLARLAAYLAELGLWNRRLGLVKAEGDELIARHILDSLAALSFIRTLPHATIADVGSGAGLPGIPLALFLDESRFALIERSGRSASFLRNATLLCELAARVEVVESDLARVDREFEVVVFRALSPLPEVVEPLLRLVTEGGSLVAYKGRRAVVDEELAKLGLGEGGASGSSRLESRIIPIAVPFLHEERTLVVLSRRRD